MNILKRRVPIIAWLPQYNLGKFLQDALAGTTVGLTAIPQGIAYAVVAGLPPQYGLYSSFMGCFIYLIFGSSKDVTVGPTAIMGLLVQRFVKDYGEDFAVTLCFTTGCLITLLGLLHLGCLVDFISMPVICGFTNAAAIIIASSQFSTVLGISGRADSFQDALVKLIHQYDEIKLWDTILGIGSIILLLILKNLPGKRQGNYWKKCLWLLSLARNALVVITGIVLAYWLSVYGYKPFKITGNISEGLPSFSLPPFSTTHNNVTYSLRDILDIYGKSVISVPLIALLESIAIAKAFAKGKTLDSNQEMIAVGMCNVFGSFVRSMPVTGSFTRTAVNNSSGVKTPMGGLITGGLVLLACGFLTSTFKYIPKATLAAVILVAMYYMLEIRMFHVLWRSKKLDLIPLTVTLLICLWFSLEIGMISGITSNLVILLYGSARPSLLIENRTINGTLILMVVPQESLGFPAAEYFREQIINGCNARKETKIVIIDGHNVQVFDSTVAKNLLLLLSDLEERKLQIFLWNWSEEIRQTITAFDFSTKPYFYTTSSLAQLITENISSTGIRIQTESSSEIDPNH